MKKINKRIKIGDKKSLELYISMAQDEIEEWNDFLAELLKRLAKLEQKGKHVSPKENKKIHKIISTEYCLNCWKKLKAVKDPVAKKVTGYLYTCSCMPKGTFISKG